MKSEMKNVITYITEIQRITRDYYELLHANKMDKFPEMYSLPRLNQEEIEVLPASAIFIHNLARKQLSC